MCLEVSRDVPFRAQKWKNDSRQMMQQMPIQPIRVLSGANVFQPSDVVDGQMDLCNLTLNDIAVIALGSKSTLR